MDFDEKLNMSRLPKIRKIRDKQRSFEKNEFLVKKKNSKIKTMLLKAEHNTKIFKEYDNITLLSSNDNITLLSSNDSHRCPDYYTNNYQPDIQCPHINCEQIDTRNYYYYKLAKQWLGSIFGKRINVAN
jgi:hypothetical protein